MMMVFDSQLKARVVPYMGIIEQAARLLIGLPAYSGLVESK